MIVFTVVESLLSAGQLNRFINVPYCRCQYPLLSELMLSRAMALLVCRNFTHLYFCTPSHCCSDQSEYSQTMGVKRDWPSDACDHM